MRRYALVMVTVVTIVALSASPAWAKKKKPKHKEHQYTNEQLATGLLQLTDFPTGWSVDPTPNPNAFTASATGGYCNGPNRFSRAQTAGGNAETHVEYDKSPTIGPVLFDQLYAFATSRSAKAFIKSDVDAVASCKAFDDVINGQTLHVTVGQLSQTRLGDQTVAFRETETRPESPNNIAGTQDVIDVRKGNVVLSYQIGGLSISSQDEQQLLGKCVDAMGRMISAVGKKK